MRFKGRSLGEGGACQCSLDLEETIFKSHVKQLGQPAALHLFSTSSGLVGARGEAGVGRGPGPWQHWGGGGGGIGGHVGTPWSRVLSLPFPGLLEPPYTLRAETSALVLIIYTCLSV